MVELRELEVGFPDVEQFCLDLEGKYRSTVTGGLREKGKGSPEWQIVRLCMNLKMIDERKTYSKLKDKKCEVCWKGFFMELRLRQHQNIHNIKNIKKMSLL